MTVHPHLKCVRTQVLLGNNGVIPSSHHKVFHVKVQLSKHVAIMLNLYKKNKTKPNIHFVFILSMEKIIIMPNVIL